MPEDNDEVPLTLGPGKLCLTLTDKEAYLLWDALIQMNVKKVEQDLGMEVAAEYERMKNIFKEYFSQP